MAHAVAPSGRVYAVEPTDFAFSRLKRNLELNPELGGVLLPLQAFLGAPGGPAPPTAVYASWKLVEEPERHPVHGGTMKTIAGARALTLDALVEEQQISRLDLIKIDVDGGERDVLAGAQRTLETLRPRILIELSPHQAEEAGSSLAELLASLGGLGYLILSEDGRRALPSDPERLAREIPQGGSINALAVPRLS
jgi:FkbM family methyltransferase